MTFLEHTSRRTNEGTHLKFYLIRRTAVTTLIMTVHIFNDDIR